MGASPGLRIAHSWGGRGHQFKPGRTDQQCDCNTGRGANRILGVR
jgi:hypothetical protein